MIDFWNKNNFYLLLFIEKNVQLIDDNTMTANLTVVVQPPILLRNPLDMERNLFRYDNFPERFKDEYFETQLIRKASKENAVEPTFLPSSKTILFSIL